MRVIGTAGHVDHGKSTLIAALTGVHPDRLKEEREREMTIDLGFGWLTLPDGEEVGIVDVPGHRDFIENMLAGVGGIDAALLVIAADEGVMPQTREHLAILDLLQIPAGLIVLTKTDLASDPAWLDLVERDVRAAVAGTVMQDAPLVRVSARNKAGLDALVSALADVLQGNPARPDHARPRLPIDRVFSMSGFGTVVTGTLSDGALSVEDEIEILPAALKGRVRGLQTHKKKETTARPGSRTAVNITGISIDRIRRGDVLTQPGLYQPARRLDARLHLLRAAAAPLKHNSEVKFFIGTSERIATLRLLGTEALEPGDEAWIQLELRDPVVAARGDRFILRRPSPAETLGGGEIVDPQPKGRHKRFDDDLLRSLAALAQGSPADVLLEAALALDAAPISALAARSRLEPARAAEALNTLLQSGKLVQLEAGEPGVSSDLLAIARPRWDATREKIAGILTAYHRSFALRRGMPREELKSRLKLPARVFTAVIRKLTAEHAIEEPGGLVALPGHAIRFDPAQQAAAEALMRKFEQSPHAPPGVKEAVAEVGEEVFNALISSGRLVTVSPEVAFRKPDYDAMVEAVTQAIRRNQRISLAEVRDLLNTSRKYAQALLEHLDASGTTVRDGDFRKLKN